MEETQSIVSSQDLGEHIAFARELRSAEFNDEYITQQLEKRGLTPEMIRLVISQASITTNSQSNDRAMKDLVVGGLFMVGGTILTLADVGYIFWGAIVFGGIQFFRGLTNFNK